MGRRLWPVCLAAAAILAATPREAVACSCAVQACTTAASYDAVFEATVDAIDVPSVPVGGQMSTADPVEVRLRDVRALRGDAPSVVITARSSVSCGYRFMAGRRYLIFASRRPTDGRLEVSFCGLTRRIEGQQGLVNYVRSLDTPSRAGRVFGRVLAPGVPVGSYDPQPVAGARVRLLALGPGSREVFTDAFGAFDFGDVPWGDYGVAVDLPAVLTPMGSHPAPATLSAAQACQDVLVFAQHTSGIGGVAVDATGSPLRGVPITIRAVIGRGQRRAFEHRVETGSDGRFSVQLAPARYEVGVSLDAGPAPMNPYPRTYATGPEGSPEIEVRLGERVELPPFVLRPLARLVITGRVVSAAGTPVAGVDVAASAVGDNGIRFVSGRARTDADGRFTVRVYEGRDHRLVLGDRRSPSGVVNVADLDQPVLITLPTP
jgi:hypothetical protein